MNFLNIKKPKWLLYIAEIILILIGIIFRVKLYLYNQSFYWDECALGSNLIKRNYLELFSSLNYHQCAPPFFLVISKFILDISHQYGHLYRQDLALRLFPLFCSCVSLPLFAIFLNKITKNKILVWIALAMMSFNNCAICYAALFKQYSCELMFSLILLLIFFDFSINISRKKLTLYSFVICASIWFSGTALFLIVTGLIYFIFRCFNKSFFNEINSNLLKFIEIIIIPFFYNLYIYIAYYFNGVYDALNGDMTDFWHFAFLTINNISNWFLDELQSFIYVPILLIGFVIFVLLNILILSFRKDIENKVKFFILTPILLLIIASFMHKYPFCKRLFLFLLPMFIILYCQITYFVKYMNKKIINILKIILIIIFSILFVLKINQPANEQVFEQEATREIVEFAKQNNIPLNKIIIVPIFKAEEYYLKAIYNYNNDENKLLFMKHIYGNYYDFLSVELKKYPKGDYWFFNMFIALHPHFDSSAPKFFKDNNKHFKILKTYHYKSPEYVYIIHFEKMSDY